MSCDIIQMKFQDIYFLKDKQAIVSYVVDYFLSEHANLSPKLFFVRIYHNSGFEKLAKSSVMLESGIFTIAHVMSVKQVTSALKWSISQIIVASIRLRYYRLNSRLHTGADNTIEALQ